MGYTDAQVTASGPDAGLDVVATAAVAQVKFRQQAVNRPALQQLVGARGPRPGATLFFSLSGYTADARRYAEQAGIATFLLHPDGSLEAVNAMAQGMTTALVAPLEAPYGESSVQLVQTRPRGRFRRAWRAKTTWIGETWRTAWFEFQVDRGHPGPEEDRLISGGSLLSRGILLLGLGMIGTFALAFDNSPSTTIGSRVSGVIFYALIAVFGGFAARLGHQRHRRLSRTSPPPPTAGPQDAPPDNWPPGPPGGPRS